MFAGRNRTFSLLLKFNPLTEESFVDITMLMESIDVDKFIMHVLKVPTYHQDASSVIFSQEISVSTATHNCNAQIKKKIVDFLGKLKRTIYLQVTNTVSQKCQTILSSLRTSHSSHTYFITDLLRKFFNFQKTILFQSL